MPHMAKRMHRIRSVCHTQTKQCIEEGVYATHGRKNAQKECMSLTNEAVQNLEQLGQGPGGRT